MSGCQIIEQQTCHGTARYVWLRGAIAPVEEFPLLAGLADAMRKSKHVHEHVHEIVLAQTRREA